MDAGSNAKGMWFGRCVDYIAYPDEADPPRYLCQHFWSEDDALAWQADLVDEYLRTDMGRWIEVTGPDGKVVEEITMPPCNDDDDEAN